MRNKNVVINIASDGIEEEVVRDLKAEEDVYRQRVKNYISEFLQDTVCGRMFFNVCYKRSVVHSDVADTVLYDIGYDESGNVKKTEAHQSTASPLNRGYREMLRRDIDIIRMAVEECRSHGAEGWFSVRMNDHHYPDDRGFNSTLGYDCAEELGVNGSRTYLNFTKDRVQRYYKAYIQELCENYEIDGIELDFLRSCPIMEDVTAENIEKINSFVRELREITKAVNEKIQMAVRVYPTVEKNLGFGLDAAQWIAEGCVDIITVENWYIPTWFNIPVERWRGYIDEKNKKRHPYTLLCGTDWAVDCDRTTYVEREMWLSLEQFKGFASGVYSRGADGIYLFNHFNTDDDCHSYKNLGLFTCYVDEQGNKISKRVLKDKINAANSLSDSEKGMRTYVNTYASNNPYPIGLSEGKGFEFTLNTASKAEEYYCIIVGVDEESDIGVTVNGEITKRIENLKTAKGFEYKVSDEEWTFVDHVSETAACVMQFEADLSAVKDGFNSFEIISGEKPCTVRWIEIQVK